MQKQIMQEGEHMTAQPFVSRPLPPGSAHLPARVRITSLEMLRHLADGPTPIDVSLALNGGVLSRKRIQYRHHKNGRHWWLYEGISDTESWLTGSQLDQWTHVPLGIERGCLLLELEGEPGHETTVRGCSPDEIEAILRQGVDLVFHSEDGLLTTRVSYSDARGEDPFCVSVFCYGREGFDSYYATFAALARAQPFAYERFALAGRTETSAAATPG
jgi:hypothetical protein